jgi:hypothetical protein
METDKINSPASLKTAVLFLVFNRPDTTTEVFEKYVRQNHKDFILRVMGRVRGVRVKKKKLQKHEKLQLEVDWPCER